MEKVTVPVSINHYNIAIVPDLSNRNDNKLYPRQLSDQSIYKSILGLIPSLAKDFGRLSMQKDKISLKPLNPLEIDNFNDIQPIVTVDLGKFGSKQNERIEYLNNRARNGKPNLNDDINDFIKTTETIYTKAIEKGFTADLWGFFHQGLDEYTFQISNPINSPKAKDKSRNILILITDGYIEIASQTRASCPSKQCRLLNTYQIEGFRKLCKGKDNNLEEIFKKSGYGITPVNNPVLENTEVLMLEVYDRSKSKSGRLTKHPSDFQILDLFWSDFFEKSNVRRFKIVEACNDEAELKTVIESFIKGGI